MIVPPEIRKCVVFIGYRLANGEFRLAGTAFFLAKSIGSSEHAFIYAVTARHVIEGIRNKGLSEVYLRFNYADGRARWLRSPLSDWRFHPFDPLADVAAVRVALTAEMDHLGFLVNDLATDEIIRRHNIGVGDEVFVTGLFAPHFGQQKNIPIIRIGNIAAMPEEPVQSKLGPIDAYLIEARSIGGLSGSPVFVNLGISRFIDGQVKHASSGPIFFLLGHIHGHWDVANTNVDEASQDEFGTVGVNIGIAIVVPAIRTLETIYRADFVKEEEVYVGGLREEGIQGV